MVGSDQCAGIHHDLDTPLSLSNASPREAIIRQVMDALMKQEEGLLLWRTSSAERPYLIRSLRTRETWDFETEVEAADAYSVEVEHSRDCSVVQKKLGTF